jgi:hypothetical protein
LHEPAFCQHTSRRRIVGKDMSGDLHQSELLEGVLAHTLNNSGHNAPTPKWLRQPVADLGPMRFADLDTIEATAADQGVGGVANGEVDGTPLLLGDLCDQGEPFVGVVLGVREGNAKGAFVSVQVVEMFDEGILVRRAKLG